MREYILISWIGIVINLLMVDCSSSINDGTGINTIPTVDSDEYIDDIDGLESKCQSQILSYQNMPENWLDSCCIDILAGYFDKDRKVGYQIDLKDTCIVKTVFWGWWEKSHDHLNEIDRMLLINHYLSNPQIYLSSLYESGCYPSFHTLAIINCWQAYILSARFPELSFLQEEFLQRERSMNIPGFSFCVTDEDESVSYPEEILDPVSDPWRINILTNGNTESLDSLCKFYADQDREWMMTIWYEWVADRIDRPDLYKSAIDALSKIALSSSQAKRAQNNFLLKYNQATKGNN